MPIDIVDENNRVIGKKDKDEVHRDGDYHRVSHVWVYNSKGDVLCHRRADCKKMFPGLWDVIVGGHVDSGESYIEAAIRELEEETGIAVKEEELVEIGEWNGVANPSAPNNREFIKIFALRYDGDFGLLKFDEREISELRSINIEELRKIKDDEDRGKEFVSFVYVDKIMPRIENLVISR